jgi:ABC-type Co2+ transport system permease subunit
MEQMNRLIKYLIMGLVVALACIALPQKKMEIGEILMIAVVASATFLIIDTYFPSPKDNPRYAFGSI